MKYSQLPTRTRFAIGFTGGMVLAIIITILLGGCGSDNDDKRTTETVQGEQGEAGPSIIGATGPQGIPGKDAEADAVIVIDPCGDDEDSPDEILLRLNDSTLVSFYKHRRSEFLTSVEPGDYVTDDKQECEFTVDEDLNVNW